jgi:hypothetical protein
MNFWTRFRWIASGMLVSLWLIAVAASWWAGDSNPRVKPTACTTNCL